jgi:hypothetical protein
MSHPSTLRLDEHALAADPEIATHAAGCQRCAAYLQEQRAWRDDLSAPVPRRPKRRLWAAGAIAFAAAAALLLVLQDDYVGVKGGPTVRVFVKHQERVSAWDGRAPITPGDALQLRLKGAPFAAVIGLHHGERVVLHKGPLDRAREQPLPVSFVVDAAPGEERLWIVFADAPLDDAAALAAPPTRVLTFAKDTP